MLFRSHRAGLVDIYRFLIAPVVVGTGSRVFEDQGPASTLTVTSSAFTDSGVASLELIPGEFRQATAIVEDGTDTIQPG